MALPTTLDIAEWDTPRLLRVISEVESAMGNGTHIEFAGESQLDIDRYIEDLYAERDNRIHSMEVGITDGDTGIL